MWEHSKGESVPTGFRVNKNVEWDRKRNENSTSGEGKKKENLVHNSSARYVYLNSLLYLHFDDSYFHTLLS